MENSSSISISNIFCLDCLHYPCHSKFKCTSDIFLAKSRQKDPNNISFALSEQQKNAKVQKVRSQGPLETDNNLKHCLRTLEILLSNGISVTRFLKVMQSVTKSKR